MTVLEQIQELEREAGEHKRARRFHQKRLRECMTELEKLRKMAGDLGLGFKTKGEEETQGHVREAAAQHR